MSVDARWRRTASPSVEPLTRTEAKLFCRVDHTADDDLIDALIKSARERIEEDLERALITQTWQLSLSGWPSTGVIRLPRAPLAAVTSVVYVDDDGNSNTFSSAGYSINTAAEPGELLLPPSGAWPSASLYPGLSITITYTAGYGAASSAVPASILAALRLLVKHLYDNRETVVIGRAEARLIPMSVNYLLDPYRIPGDHYP